MPPHDLVPDDPPTPLAERLLDQEPLPAAADFAAYREKLQQAIAKYEWRKQLVGRVAVVAMVVALGLMFVGGSQVVGSFDPTDDRATPLSIALATLYVIAAITAPLAIASYYSRLGPRLREAKERLRDETLHELQHEIAKLRQEVAKTR